MVEKLITAECIECESIFEMSYQQELVSKEVPCFCPFCGEKIEDVQEEEYIDEDDFDENEEWR